jgi:hypothetical protein
MGAGELHAHAGAAEPIYRLAVEAVGGVASAHEGLRTRFHPKCPIRSAGVGHLEQPLMSSGRCLVHAGARGGLD